MFGLLIAVILLHSMWYSAARKSATVVRVGVDDNGRFAKAASANKCVSTPTKLPFKTKA